MRITSIQIRKLQRIFSAGILLIIILMVSPYLIHIPETEGTGATKLIIVYEKIPVKVNVPKKLIVKAVDDKGRLDGSRNDLIELNLTSLSYPKPLAKLSQHTLNLVNGTATVTLMGPLKEMLLITVLWKEGKTSLESHSILIQVGGARMVNNELMFKEIAL
ncbi:MAG: hypothetical protein NWE90_06160 [Candidatus Bathyarchaeota archaeon]|nr:hypothetical protein [Candidatus Bathyarchaeota archaeon]